MCTSSKNEKRWRFSATAHTHTQKKTLQNNEPFVLVAMPCCFGNATQRNQFDTETHTSRIYFPELFLLYNLSVDVSMRTQSSCYLFISFFLSLFCFIFDRIWLIFGFMFWKFNFWLKSFRIAKKIHFYFDFFPCFFHFLTNFRHFKMQSRKIFQLNLNAINSVSGWKLGNLPGNPTDFLKEAF